MPQKITSKDVCRHIIGLRREFYAKRLSDGNGLVYYPYSIFKEDMASEDFIASKVTVSAKWRTLEMDRIVVYNGGRAYLDIRNLYLRAGMTPPVAKAGCIHTQTEEESE